MRELEQCQQGVQAAELRSAELEEEAAEHQRDADAAAARRRALDDDVAQVEAELARLRQQAKVCKQPGVQPAVCRSREGVADQQSEDVLQAVDLLLTVLCGSCCVL